MMYDKVKSTCDIDSMIWLEIVLTILQFFSFSFVEPKMVTFT